LIAEVVKNPVHVEVGEINKVAETVEQHFYAVSARAKMDLLVHVLQNEDVETMLVFSRTKRGADRIAHRLERKGLQAVAIHSNRSQSQRQRALEAFKGRQCRILVATDIAARGIDVDRISHVVNYDTPQFAEDYVHRIGRTGRASATGAALTFVSHEEEKYLKRIEQAASRRCTLKHYDGFVDPEHRPLSSTASERHPRDSAAHERRLRVNAAPERRPRVSVASEHQPRVQAEPEHRPVTFGRNQQRGFRSRKRR
jgi:ATP-dependent RNA helicase RhlE